MRQNDDSDTVHRIAKVDPQPRPDVVKALRELLEQAEAGQINHVIFIATEVEEDSFTTGIYGHCQSRSSLMGRLELLKLWVWKFHDRDDG